MGTVLVEVDTWIDGWIDCWVEGWIDGSPIEFENSCTSECQGRISERGEIV